MSRLRERHLELLSINTQVQFISHSIVRREKYTSTHTQNLHTKTRTHIEKIPTLQLEYYDYLRQFFKPSL